MIQNFDMIKKTWMLLDTCYTDIIADNFDYFECVNNYAKDEDLTVLKNGGSLIFDHKLC